jgi:hypothetical protein
MRRRLLLNFVVLLLFGSSSSAQTQYFPPCPKGGSQWECQFKSEWYSDQLRALDEPPLWSLSKTQGRQSYRFLWLRTFHHPVAIRLDVNSDGTSRLATKMTSGAGGFKPGHLIQQDVVTLTKTQTDWFLGKIDENKFWELPSKDVQSAGLDGSQWIIEAVKNGNYHIVDRWTPGDGPVRVLGLLMVNDLAKLKIPADEIY